MPQWNMGLFSVVIPTSSAFLGKAGFLKVRRRSLYAAGDIMRKAGWRRAMAEELWVLRSPPAIVEETGTLRNASTSI